VPRVLGFWNEVRGRSGPHNGTLRGSAKRMTAGKGGLQGVIYIVEGKSTTKKKLKSNSFLTARGTIWESWKRNLKTPLGQPGVTQVTNENKCVGAKKRKRKTETKTKSVSKKRE